MEVVLQTPSRSPSVGGDKTICELTDVSKQVWEFVESQCFSPEGEVNHQNVAFWLRTLLQQNSDLVEVVARLERESKERVNLLESKLNKSARSASDLTGGLAELQEKLQKEEEDKQLLDDTIKELEHKLQESVEDNKASELLVNSLSDQNKEILDINKNLECEIKSIEEENKNLREYTENLRSDIDALLKLSSRARDTGIWDPHNLNFCEVTFEQVFGDGLERSGTPGAVGHQKVVITSAKKNSHGEDSQNSSHIYDSRSSLQSELSDLQRKGDVIPIETEDISLRSDVSNNKIRELRQQVLKTQQRCSDQVKESVMKDRLVAELQTQITELNGEMDDLKEENNANLSVINKLKDTLYETKAQLSIHEEDTDQSRVPSCHISSSASLPDIPPELYTSKFARSLTRRCSGSSSLIQQLTDQLDLARRDQRSLEHQLQELLTQVELTNTERLQTETQLVQVRSELQELMSEHENLKDDFRTLVRSREDRTSKLCPKCRDKSPCSSTSSLAHSKRIPDATSHSQVQQLEQSLFKLQHRDSEMEEVVNHLDNVNRELEERDKELVNLRIQCDSLQHELAEQTSANVLLSENLDQMRQTIEELQKAVESRRIVDVVQKPSQRSNIPLPVRVIYKAESELSDGEDSPPSLRAHSHTPSSFIMSSSDSFNI